MPFLFLLFFNFKTPVKYLEKQTELNSLCLYIKKYTRIKKTWKNKNALGVVQNYQCKKLKTTFGSYFFTYLPILANCISKCLSYWVASGWFYKFEVWGKLTKIWVKMLEQFLLHGFPAFLGCFDPKIYILYFKYQNSSKQTFSYIFFI